MVVVAVRNEHSIQPRHLSGVNRELDHHRHVEATQQGIDHQRRATTVDQEPGHTQPPAGRSHRWPRTLPRRTAESWGSRLTLRSRTLSPHRLAASLRTQRGRCAFVGEGPTTFAVSEPLIHMFITLYGSWVTSLRHMEDLLEHLVRAAPGPRDGRHPPLPPGPARRGLPDRRRRSSSGKVCIVMD